MLITVTLKSQKLILELNVLVSPSDTTLAWKVWKSRSGNTASMTSRQPVLNIKAHTCGRLPTLQVTHRRFDYLTGRYYPLLKWQRRTRGHRKASWPGGTTCCSGGWSKWLLSASAGSSQWPAAPLPALSPLPPLQDRHSKKRTRKTKQKKN